MKKNLLFPLIMGAIIVAGCDVKDHCLDQGGRYDYATKTCEKSIPGLIYSNLVDQASQAEVKTALLQAGIAEENVKKFFEQVAFFNQHAGTESLVQSGFIYTGTLVPEYDLATIISNLEKNSPNFIGYNCRITSFSLMRYIITIAKLGLVNASQLFMDQDALKTSPQKIFSPEEQKQFESFYSLVPTITTKDQTVHFEKIKKSWSEKGISFKHAQASLISVWMHSHFEGEEDFLFIGHIGVLLDIGKELLFVEKLAFNEPYQAIKFATRADLIAYLKAKYDTEYNQPTASPIVLENDQPLGALSSLKK